MLAQKSRESDKFISAHVGTDALVRPAERSSARCPICREPVLRAHLGESCSTVTEIGSKTAYARVVPCNLHRFHESRQSHFLTFSCHHRQPYLDSPTIYDLFLRCLEDIRRQFALRIYGYVAMPEHVHLLVSEPEHDTLADAIRCLKLSFSKRLYNLVPQVPRAGFASSPGTIMRPETFWQKRYYDRNVRDEHEFTVKLRYLHRNPVKRGLVKEPGDWKWSSFRHYALREQGMVEVESEWTARDRETAAGNGAPRIFLVPR